MGRGRGKDQRERLDDMGFCFLCVEMMLLGADSLCIVD
jgi:hypothetical protein